MYKFYFAMLAMVCALSVSAQTVRTKLGSPATTDWSTAAAWSPSGVPQAGERIVIPAGVTANISTNVSYTSLFVDISGTLSFSSNRMLTMTSASSYINLRSGGRIQASNTSNASTKITINTFTQFVGNRTYSTNSGGLGLLRGPASATGQSQNFVFGVILAQSLVDFKLIPSDQKISLRWTVKADPSNRLFEIQRSTDGVNWSSIGSIPVNGETSNYAFDDSKPASGLNYYRLRTLDQDGKSWFSMIRTSYNGAATTALKVVPNPAVGSARVLIPGSFTTAGAEIRVIDRTGKLMSQKQVPAGSKLAEVDVKSMHAGQYVLQLVGSNGQKTSTTLVVANQ